MKNKKVIFIVRNKEVKSLDANDITVEEVESTKNCLAFIHGVTYDEIEVVTQDEHELEKSNFYITLMGLCYKAPREYAIYKPVHDFKFDRPYNFKYQDHIDDFLDKLSLYLKRNNPTELDDLIKIV